ncbi:MAG: helix-hairpin-helix domain-containing protein [Planctomycetota bacterium]
MNAAAGGNERSIAVRRAVAATVAVLGLGHLGFSVGTVARGGPAVGPAPNLRLRLDPNAASAEELALLPRIGPQRAQNIVAYRAAAGRQPAFRTTDDLDAVPRIGPVTVEALRPHLLFADRSTPREKPRESP